MTTEEMVDKKIDILTNLWIFSSILHKKMLFDIWGLEEKSHYEELANVASAIDAFLLMESFDFTYNDIENSAASLSVEMAEFLNDNKDADVLCHKYGWDSVLKSLVGLDCILKEEK